MALSTGPRSDILATVGNTPLVRLGRLLPHSDLNIYAKLEGFNPGGSIKDRTALNLVRDAVQEGKLKPGGYVIESSSGNLGIALSQTCLYYGLKFICVVDPKATQTNLNIMRTYGAEIDLITQADPATGEYLAARIARVRTLLRQIPNSFCPDQYSNWTNPRAHHATIKEILDSLGGKLDYLLCATSTCGTLRGASEYLRSNGFKTRVFAVDAHGSVIFGHPAEQRLIPGHGASITPPLFYPELADTCVHVSDLDCVAGCKLLLSHEAILAGGSSGAVISALLKVQRQIPAGSTVALILSDRGERYLDTVYSDTWVREKLYRLRRPAK